MTRRSPTASQTIGPFFGFALPFPAGSTAAQPASPEAIHIEGRVLDGRREGVSDALLEAWSGEQFARCRTDPEGAFHFWLRRPSEPFVELTVFARGLLRQLATRVYLSDTSDPVLEAVPAERRHTLIATEEPGGSLRFDVRLQGDDETVFFAL